MGRARGNEAIGLAALRDGRWAAARDAFARALASRETAEAWEGASWAAWWLDDAEAVFAAREQAYRLYRQRDDSASAARMATWLAADQLDFHGAMAVASGWLGRARRLLATLPPGPDHGWLAFHEGYIAMLRGEIDEAQELGARAAELGKRLGVPDLEMLGLAIRGSTLVRRARVVDGMRCLDEAATMALAGEAAIPISCAWACCFLVSACTSVLDYQRASEWCDRIAAFADRYGSRYMLAFCRAEYGAVELWRGRWRDAEELLEQSIDDFSRSRPAMVAGPLVALAELRRRQGRPAQAEQLLDRAGASSSAQLCRARLALDRGRPSRAIELIERMLRQIPEHRSLDRFATLELMVRARVAAGDLAAAAAALAELRRLQRRVDTAPMRATVDVAAGILAAARGEHARARAFLEDAVDGFEACGAPFEAALSRVELCASLLAAGDAESSRREAALARARLQELGAAADLERIVSAAPAGAAPSPVTRREREVLSLLARGLTNRQIGDRLRVSEHTVHRHVTNILRKLDLPSRAAAAAHAVAAGLVHAGD